jgi:hypothetical protein
MNNNAHFIRIYRPLKKPTQLILETFGLAFIALLLVSGIAIVISVLSLIFMHNNGGRGQQTGIIGPGFSSSVAVAPSSDFSSNSNEHSNNPVSVLQDGHTGVKCNWTHYHHASRDRVIFFRTGKVVREISATVPEVKNSTAQFLLTPSKHWSVKAFKAPSSPDRVNAVRSNQDDLKQGQESNSDGRERPAIL